MIERKIIKERINRLNIKKRIRLKIRKSAGVGDISIEPTPLGERITLSAVRPGLVIGRGGSNVKEVTQELRESFKLENPQIKVNEEEKPYLSAKIVAEMIASKLERFGVGRFKATGYRALDSIMQAGAIGAEIRISGKIPSSRSRSWRFFSGYLKKCGETSRLVDSAVSIAKVKPGTVGIKVSIMPPGIKLPDQVTIKKQIQIEEESKKEADKLKEEVKEAAEEDKAKTEKKPKDKRKTKTKKKAKKANKKKKVKKDKKSSKSKSNGKSKGSKKTK